MRAAGREATMVTTPRAAGAAVEKRGYDWAKNGDGKRTKAMVGASNSEEVWRGGGADGNHPSIPRGQVSGGAPGCLGRRKFSSDTATTDTPREVSYNGKVGGRFRPVPRWLRGVGPHGRKRPKTRGRTGFDRMARGSDCVPWLVGWPR